MHNSQLDFRAGFASTWELMLLAQSNKRRPFLHSIMCYLFPFLTYAIIIYFNKALTLVFFICITNPLYSPYMLHFGLAAIIALTIICIILAIQPILSMLL